MLSPDLKTCLAFLPAIALLSGCSHADCTAPQPPAHQPDGYTAKKDEMAAAVKEFKAYNDAVNGYLACIDKQALAAVDKDPTSDQARQMKREADKKHDEVVDDLQDRVEKFNTEVRAYDSLHR